MCVLSDSVCVCVCVLSDSMSLVPSGLGGDTERVNALLKQYMCPAVYQ